MPSVGKNGKSNAEGCKDYKQKNKLNDASFREKERIRVSAYRVKKKEKGRKNYSA